MYLLDIIKKIFFEGTWACAYRILESKDTNKLTTDDNKTPFKIVPVRRKYWSADPFLVDNGDKTYLFCELLDRHKSKGLLGICELKNGKNSKMKILKELNCHTSYPCVFSYKNEWYMIPETLGNCSIELFRSTKFPEEWTLEKRLLDNCEFVDTTIYLSEKEVFLYTYYPGKVNEERKLFFCKLNMETKSIDYIKEVASYSEKVGRPAGNLIKIGDKLIRPSQYSVNRYGEKIIYKHIKWINSQFQERDFQTLSPDSILIDKKLKILGVHTINRCGNYEVIDVFFNRFHPLRPIETILKKLKIGEYSFYEKSRA